MIDAFKVVPSTKAMSYIPALAQKKNNFDILKITFFGSYWFFGKRDLWNNFFAKKFQYIESVFLVYERKGLKIAPFVAFYFKPQYFLGHM